MARGERSSLWGVSVVGCKDVYALPLGGCSCCYFLLCEVPRDLPPSLRMSSYHARAKQIAGRPRGDLLTFGLVFPWDVRDTVLKVCRVRMRRPVQEMLGVRLHGKCVGYFVAYRFGCLSTVKWGHYLHQRARQGHRA